MIAIEQAQVKDFPVIQLLAEKIWEDTYTGILSNEQIDFMLENMYSQQALKKQVDEGIQFLVVRSDDEIVAFAGYSANDELIKIHKLYISTQQQGKGIGRKIINHISELAITQHIYLLELNVNRNNPALYFYQKLGFVIHQSIDIPYFQFEMNDYIMRYSLTQSPEPT